MPANAADQATDWAISQAINLSRVESGSQAEAVEILEQLEAEIVGILDKNKTSIGKQKKLQVIQKAASEAIQEHYATVKTGQQATLTGVAKASGKGQTKIINKILGASVLDPVLSDKQWEALAKDTNVFGAKSGQWWDGQSASLRDKFGKQMVMGYGLGESVEELTRRVRGTKANGFSDGIMATSKREAEALVRSSVQTISNAAKIRTIEEMQPLAKGLTWVSTLDGRTTDICMGLDKKEWRFPDMEPVGHDKQFPGPVAHWNCRSTQVPSIASWEELSGKKIPAMGNQPLQAAVEQKLEAQGMDPLKIAQVKVRARASMDGQVSSLKDYEDWLGTKSPEFIHKQLGPSRAALWKAGKLTLADMTDQNNRPLKISALEEAIEAGTLPNESEGSEFLPVTGTIGTGGQELAQANQTAQLEIDSIIANPKGQTLKAKALLKLQKDEPGLPPMQMLAKAEGIAIEKQAAASKASKLSTARKKIKQGKKPSPSEQLVIDSLEGAELDNWKESLIDAGKVASQDALDKLKGMTKLDGTVTDPTSSLKLKATMNEADAAVYKEWKELKQNEHQETLKKSLSAGLGFYDTEEEMKATATFKSLTPTNQNSLKFAFAQHQVKLKVKIKEELATIIEKQGKELNEILKEPIDLQEFMKLEAGQQQELIDLSENVQAAKQLDALAKKGPAEFQAVKQAKKAAEGLMISQKTILDQAETALLSLKATEALGELEEIQAGQAKVQKGLKQKALAKQLKADGKTLEELSPGEITELLTDVKATAAAQQAAASKASKLSTAKKKLLAGKQPTPAEQATIDALTTDEKAAWEASVQEGHKAKQTDTSQQAAAFQAPVETYTVDLIDDHVEKVKMAEQFLKEQGLPLPPNKTPFQFANTPESQWPGTHQQSEITKAMFGGATVEVIKDSNGKIVGAIDYESFDGNTNINNLGSIAPQGGTQLLKNAIDQAEFHGDTLTLEALPGAVSFYEKWGMTNQSKLQGKPPGGIDDFFNTKEEVKGIKKKIDDYLAGKKIPQPKTTLTLSDAKSQLADLLASGDTDIENDIANEFGLVTGANPNKGEAAATFQTVVDNLFDQKEADDFLLQAEAAIKKAQAKQTKALKAATAKAKKDAAAAKKQAAAAAVPDLTPSGPEVKTLPPIDVSSLKKIRDLDGSTKPYLAEDPATGARYVIKSTTKGLTQAHLKSEAAADAIYRAAGINVPTSGMPDKKTKAAEFLEGQTLAKWKAGKSTKEVDAMYKEIRKGFVADALLANHDVGGASFDNIFVTTEGIPVRIDNGGALSFRAQGGKKEGWDDPSGTVAELVSLRDSGKAPVVSQIVKGITSTEINEQIADITKRRKAILEAATKAGVTAKDRKALERRMDWLEEQLPASYRKAINAAGSSLNQIPTDLSARLKAGNRGAGTSIFASNDEFEDQQLKVWNERNTDGQLLLKAEADLTKKGDEKLKKLLKAAGVAMDSKSGPTTNAKANPNAAPQDPFENALVSAAKTMHTHAEDKGYNASTIQTLTAKGAELAQYAASGDKAKMDMAKHYQPLWDKLMDVDKDAPKAEVTKAIPLVKGFKYDPSKYKKKTIKKPTHNEGPVVMMNGWEVTRPKTMIYTQKHVGSDGILQDSGQINDIQGTPLQAMHGQVYRLRKGDVEITYQGFSGKKEQRNLQGTIRINALNGGDDAAALETAVQAINDIGIQGSAPSQAQKELLYLHKGAVLRGNDHEVAYKNALATKGTDEDKVEAVKQWAEQKYSIKLPRKQSEWEERGYNPEGIMPSNGTGQRTWQRWDYSPKEIERITKGKVLYHSGNIMGALEGWLTNAGNATSTQERARTGVHISHVGSSSGTDMNVGGGNFLYASSTTRIKAMQQSAGYLFKGRNLARLDIRSDAGDSYGAWEKAKSRTGDLKKMAARQSIGISTNTGLMKNGASIFDEIDTLLVSSEHQRKEAIALAKSLGLQKWPDGRSLEAVIQTK